MGTVWSVSCNEETESDAAIQLGFLHIVSEAHTVYIELEVCHSHGYFGKLCTALAANGSWQNKPGCKLELSKAAIMLVG